MTDIGIKRGDIFYADLRPVVGSEQGGIRPVLILQNNMGNKHSPTTIVAMLTSKISKKELPTHITLHKEDAKGLPKDSVILCEQIRTIDKRRIKEKVGSVNDDSLELIMGEVKNAFNISLGF